jgi:glucose-6-phosphate dehydrogenase assembly protein OpcA
MEGKSAYLVPNTVLSRLDSDLPLIFWWQGQLSENFEPTLYTRIDRLIIDSGEWQNPIEQLSRLEIAYQEPGSHFNVMDLAWTRVLQLRLAMAACFDDPIALAELPRMTAVEICHSKSHGLDARMLAAWMAHQAGWTVVGTSSEDHASLESKEGISISLRFLHPPHRSIGVLPSSARRNLSVHSQYYSLPVHGN